LTIFNNTFHKKYYFSIAVELEDTRERKKTHNLEDSVRMNLAGDKIRP